MIAGFLLLVSRTAGKCVLFILAILSGALVFAEEARAPFTPVTRDEVWQTIAGELRARGIPGDQLPRAEDIELPAAVPAAPGRALRVTMVCWDAALERTQFRLECREAGQCVPFLAYTRAGRFGNSCQAGPWSRPVQAASHKAVVRAGDRATVVFRGNRLRLSAQVTCLERGAEGEIIRVRNQDGRIFRARVSAPALLEASSQ
jgi:Chaperone for flagella basal body P-ring formation